MSADLGPAQTPPEPTPAPGRQVPDCPAGERLIGAAEVWELASISASTGYRLLRRGLMPQPIRLTGQHGRRWWRLRVIEQWIANGCPPQGDAGAQADGERRN